MTIESGRANVMQIFHKIKCDREYRIAVPLRIDTFKPC